MRFRIFLAALALLQASTSATDAAEPFSFRDYKLGMHIWDVRRIPFPDDPKPKGVQFVCDGDTKAVELKIPRMVKDNQIDCEYYAKDSIPSIWNRVSPMLGNVEPALSFFHFTPKSAGYYGERLYGIDIYVYAVNFPSLVDLFKLKWGSPSKVQTEEVKNHLGGTFMNEILTWDNDVSEIVYSKYGDSLRTSTIKFRHKSLSQIFYDSEKEKKKELLNKL